LKRKILALIVISVIIVGASSYALYIYAFTTDGIPAGTCSEFSFVSGRPNLPFKLLVVPNASQSVGTEATYWCIYGGNNFLLRSYQTNVPFPTPPSHSANGEYVALSGFQRATVAVGDYGRGAIYLFDKSGRMLWNVSTSQGSWESAINSNGSVVIGYGQDLYYINNQGKLLWNYSNLESLTAALVNDGSYVADGSSYVPQTYGPPNSSMVSSNLVLFDSTGKAVWNDSIPGEVIESVTSVAVSNGHIVLGVTQIAADQGTLLYYDLQGKLIWSKTINASLANDDVYFQNNGSQIYVGWWTSGGHLIYDLNGNEIGS
jgi:hypothetical protein